jgi:hypothetical protein
VETDDGITAWIDVKTINPEAIDRWDQFQSLRESGRFGPVKVIYKEDWLGGELHHGAYAARAKMLEYTLEFEAKIKAGDLANSEARACLVFCGNGFYWDLGDLEDFLKFYFTRAHAVHDRFREMELYHLATKRISLERTVPHFGYLERQNVFLTPLNREPEGPEGSCAGWLTFHRLLARTP